MIINFLNNNRSAIYSMLSLVMRVVTGPLSILFIVNSLSIEQQAIYYAFITISSIQWVFELGVTTSLVQYIGKEKNRDKVRAAVKLGLILFFGIGIVAFSGMNIYAAWLFSDMDSALWHEPFLAYSLTISINILNNIALIVDEAKVNSQRFYLKKLVSAIAYSSVLLLSLYFGGQLYALAFAQLAMITIYAITSSNSYKIILSSISISNDRVLSVFREIRSFQAKVAIVWFIGYCYWNFYSVFILKFIGAELSAQFGITNAVLSALAFAATSLLQTKRVDIGREISAGHILKTSKAFYFYICCGFAFYVLMSLVFYFAMGFLPDIYTVRFFSNQIFAQYALLRLIVMVSEMVLIYFRMFLEEPIYKLTLINYVVTPLSCVPSYLIFGIDMLFLFPLCLHLIFMFGYFVKLKVFVNEKQNAI
ncbi:hypothetical protein ACEUAT_14255 [Aeromonas veronii]|uniref:hypothetical protein n=1 Tax=Aeromonas veronii TaxID=654 RepID=UPI00300784FD